MKEMILLENSISSEINESINVKKKFSDSVEDENFQNFEPFIDKEKLKIVKMLNLILNEVLNLFTVGLDQITDFENQHKK
jgi:hypothetical protein